MLRSGIGIVKNDVTAGQLLQVPAGDPFPLADPGRRLGGDGDAPARRHGRQRRAARDPRRPRCQLRRAAMGDRRLRAHARRDAPQRRRRSPTATAAAASSPPASRSSPSARRSAAPRRRRSSSTSPAARRASARPPCSLRRWRCSPTSSRAASAASRSASGAPSPAPRWRSARWSAASWSTGPAGAGSSSSTCRSALLLIWLDARAGCRESRDPAPRRLDLAGMATFGGACFLATYALIRGNADGWAQRRRSLASLAAAGAPGCRLRSHRATRRPAPMLPLRAVPHPGLHRHRAGRLRAVDRALPAAAVPRHLLPGERSASRPPRPACGCYR